MYYLKYIPLKLVNFCGFFFKQFFLSGIGIFNGRKIIHIRYNRLILCSVAGRDLFKCSRIFNIFYTVFAQNDSPVGFSLCWICRNYLFIKLLCLIKLIFHTKVVGTVEVIGEHIIVAFGYSLLSSAILTLADGHTLCYFKRTSAHLTLKYCHFSYPPCSQFMNKYSILYYIIKRYKIQ